MSDKRIRINELLYEYISLIGKGNFKEGFNKIITSYTNQHSQHSQHNQNNQNNQYTPHGQLSQTNNSIIQKPLIKPILKSSAPQKPQKPQTSVEFGPNNTIIFRNNNKTQIFPLQRSAIAQPLNPKLSPEDATILHTITSIGEFNDMLNKKDKKGDKNAKKI